MNPPGEKPVTVLIIDDDRWVTRGLSAVLSGEIDIEVLATATSGEEGLGHYRRMPADVVLMDINMGPSMSGIDATKELLEIDAEARVLILTTMSPGPGLGRALEAGALAAIDKNASAAVLIASIRAAASGDTAFLMRGLGTNVWLSGSSEVDPYSVSPVLTRAEKKVLVLLCQGLDYSEIAAELTVALSTVETHAKHLRHKFGVKNVAQLVVKSIQLRYIAP